MELTVEGYQQVKNNLVTHHLEIDVCLQCYYEISKYRAASGEPLHTYLSLFHQKVKGKRPLYPSITVGNAIHKVDERYKA